MIVIWLILFLVYLLNFVLHRSINQDGDKNHLSTNYQIFCHPILPKYLCKCSNPHVLTTFRNFVEIINPLKNNLWFPCNDFQTLDSAQSIADIMIMELRWKTLSVLNTLITVIHLTLWISFFILVFYNLHKQVF